MPMTPRLEAAVADPGPVRLADPNGRKPEAMAIDKQTITERRPPTCAQVNQQVRQTLPAGFERMLSIDDLAALLSCSRRLVERMRSAGKVPKPDIKIGKMPRWRVETIRRWIEGGGRC